MMFSLIFVLSDWESLSKIKFCSLIINKLYTTCHAVWFVTIWMLLQKQIESIIRTSEKILRIICYKGRWEHINGFFLKSNVLSIYEFYIRYLIKNTLICFYTSKVTENSPCNITFCFTRSNTSGKLKKSKTKSNSQKNSITYRRPVLYNFC